MQGAKRVATKTMQNIFSGAETYVSKKITQAVVSRDPFEHCVIDDVLPTAVFEAIHQNWPKDTDMMRLPDTGRTEAYKERLVMLLEDRFFADQPPEMEEFWVNVAFAVMSSAVITACYGKFRATLEARVSHLKGVGRLDPELLIVSDRSDYKIGPHTDSRARLLSLLYYLSPDSKYRTYGTGLYKPKNPDMPVNDILHHPVSEFDLVSRVEYRPNRLVLFPRTDHSYHGVEPVPVENCDRRLLIVNIRAPEGAI